MITKIPLPDEVQETAADALWFSREKLRTAGGAHA